MTAITAVTVQNTKGVSDFEAISAHIVGAQIRTVVTDIGVDAAKTGMLASVDIVDAVAEAVADTRIANLVVDPVFVSKHGHPLLAEDAVGALRERILPLAELVTPNLTEAGGLAGFGVETRDDMRRAAEAILALGPRAVLVKGGHLDGTETAADLFASAASEEWIEAERIDTPHTHGTGCTLSAAIAAHLARGLELSDAVRAGKAFVTEAIRHAMGLGEGIGPVDHLWPIAPR
jgi:hydroxymethylpyrimidine/phosphomethylpyrimidine kinase